MKSKESVFLPLVGLYQATCCSETKYLGRDDLLLMILDKGSIISGCLTKSSAPSAPIMWCRKNFKSTLKRGEPIVILVNAGNANAFTGKEGQVACQRKADTLSNLFNCNHSNIFFASTGVIGEKLQVQKIINKLPILKKSLVNNNFSSAAASILTTDTKTKICSTQFMINNHVVTISGFAKGSGMIFPNMATMLAFVFTDYSIDGKTLTALTKKAVDNSFNKISVDGDTSTSDTVFVSSTRRVKIKKNKKDSNSFNDMFYEKLLLVMVNLAKSIVLDGEGAKKFIEIEVKKAKDKKSAREIAFSIANSLLVKTAIAGEDPNWGRIVMAIGKTEKIFNMEKLKIFIQNQLLTKNGSVVKNINEGKLKKELEKKYVKIIVDLDSGKYGFTAWTSDLTEQYIKINADYRS
ncbi:bifunctional ornithine acetyltransferase/N-acetylglutamate synthase [bacterium TMED277]|nr:MAG: bifunctional ornithine acetyltransferase/N-acetylglutamate synthase [bacterium TMED277]|tara:strand:- start:847 stop:2067 length:1221 start_codon:yes stop_codon:yes gene_type:complete